MNTQIKLVLLTNLVAFAFGYPYAQFGPIRTFEEQYFSPAQFQTFPQFQQVPASFSGDQCPCNQAAQRRLVRQIDTLTPAITPAEFKEYSIPPQALRPLIETGDSTWENAQVTAPPSASETYTDSRGGRSALETIVPFFDAEDDVAPCRKARSLPRPAQLEIPAEMLDVMLKMMFPSVGKSQSQVSKMETGPNQGYGMYYMRAQSFNSFDQDEDRKVEQANTKKESEVKESQPQQSEIHGTLEQLLLGQLAMMLQQQDIELLNQREFKDQESYLKEIKRQLNIIRKNGESRANIVSVSSPGVNVATELETTSGFMPDTTSTVPTTTHEAVTTTENARVTIARR